MLSDFIILILAITLLSVGLQTFMDPARRAVSSEVIKATFMMVTGFFFLYYWYTGVSSNKSGGNYYR
jgi:uncharacterized membrane protein YozB (DUF420 family)